MKRKLIKLTVLAGATASILAFQNCSSPKDLDSAVTAMAETAPLAESLDDQAVIKTDDPVEIVQDDPTTPGPLSFTLAGKNFRVVGILPANACKNGGASLICSLRHEKKPAYRHVVRFNADRTFNADLACNQMRSTFEVFGASPAWTIDIHNLTSTMRGCKGLAEEEKVGHHLQLVKQIILMSASRSEIVLLGGAYGGLRLKEVVVKSTPSSELPD